jgi:glycogen operon protein
MLAHGDELGRTQRGNNNGYCQDNEITWVDWELDEERAALLEFTRTLVHLRRDHPVLRRRRFFAGSAEHGGESELGDIAWFTTAGDHMSEADWKEGRAKALMVFLNGEAIGEPDARGEPVVDDSFLVLYNAAPDPVPFTLPSADFGPTWTCVLDTDHTLEPDATVKAAESVRIAGRSTLVLSRPVTSVPA